MKKPGDASNIPGTANLLRRLTNVTIPETPAEYRRSWREQKPHIPYGYCWCGCGEKTTISKRTLMFPPPSWGKTTTRHFKGEPLRFVQGHSGRLKTKHHKPEDRGYETECWIWQGCINADGYAVWRKKGEGRFVSRALYERVNGPMPPGFEPHHLCEQRDCVRWHHIMPVTHKQNVRLERHVKLTEQKAAEIRRLYKETELSYSQLAKLFVVSKPTIAKVITRRAWI